MRKQDIEMLLAESLGFRVSPMGNRKLDFLKISGGGSIENARIYAVKATRPATPQECEMWDRLVDVLIAASNEVSDPTLKDFLPGGGGIDARSVRDSLGNPLDEGSPESRLMPKFDE